MCTSYPVFPLMPGVLRTNKHSQVEEVRPSLFSLKGWMSMKITGRHLVVTPALRQHIESRFERLARYEVNLGHLEVILGVSKLQHCAEVVCTMQGRRIQAKGSTREMYATIDQLVDRLCVQIRKHKERQADHKEPTKASGRKILRPAIRKEEEEIEVIRPARAVLTLD
jgi:putative sigma-54 modulation protein